MKQQWLSRKGPLVLALSLASLCLLLGVQNAGAQEGQGKYLTEATVRLTKLIDAANKDGFSLQDNSFSMGGGWLKKSKEWVGLYTVELKQGTAYRILAAGDADAKDVDVQLVDATDPTKLLKEDVDTSANASIEYTPAKTGRFLVRVRLYDSAGDLPCVCLAVVMTKK
jgi:hypothetical protein